MRIATLIVSAFCVVIGTVPLAKVHGHRMALPAAPSHDAPELPPFIDERPTLEHPAVDGEIYRGRMHGKPSKVVTMNTTTS
jgi:hypothetical protein